MKGQLKKRICDVVKIIDTSSLYLVSIIDYGHLEKNSYYILSYILPQSLPAKTGTKSCLA